jgi:hypothetical protein
MWAAEESKEDNRIEMLKILIALWNAVLGVHLKDCRKGWQSNSWTFPNRKDTMVNHFQLPSQEFHCGISQAKHKAILANSLATLLFYKDQLTGGYSYNLSLTQQGGEG